MLSRPVAMKRALGAAIALGLSLCGNGAVAKIRDGNQLLQQCTATVGAHVTFCFGYIDSVMDSLLANNEVCVASEGDDPQLRDIVVRFLKNNAALGRLGAPELITRALTGAFPCQ